MHSSAIVLDHVGDANGVELHRLAKLYAFPDFVKRASAEETLRPRGLVASAYADPPNGLYPCHNAASTYLSALYFAEKRAHYHPRTADRVQARLDAAADYWGVKAAVDAARARRAELCKDADDALPDTDFGFVWADDDGRKHRHLRMKNAAEVAAASKWLNENVDALTYADRNVVAGRILEKAARYGASLGELESFVERQAGRGVCAPREVAGMLGDRAKLAKTAANRAGMEKLAATVAAKPSAALTPDMLVKLAVTVDVFDRANGLCGRHTDKIPRPEDVLFRVTYKEAQAGVGDAVSLTTGSVYDKTQFSKIALSDVKGLLGGDFASAVADGLKVDVEKLAEVAATLPRPDAELFEELLDAAGVPPLAAKEAADAVPRELLEQFAAAY